MDIQNNKKIKQNLNQLELKIDDHSFKNDLGCTILQTSENDNISSKTYIIAGRYGSRPNVNEDNSTIIIGENGNPNNELNRDTKIVKDNRIGSYILLNSQKIIVSSKDQNIEITSGDELNISSVDNITIISGKNIIVKSDSDIKINARNITFESAGDIKFKCKSFEIDSNDIKLGKGAKQSAILGNSFDSVFKTHTHPETNAGNTLVPNPSQQFISKTVKIK